MLCMVAATAPPTMASCETPEARQFDFYIGDWTIEQGIRDAEGGWIELPAETSVARAIDGCALVEHWTGDVQFHWTGMTSPAPLHGLSVRAWDADAGAWNIYWMDSQTPVFSGTYSGQFEDGTGRFYLERETPNGKRLGRITFTNVTDSSLDWNFALSRDGGESWRVMWTMAMTRKR